MKILSICPPIIEDTAMSWRISNVAEILESNGHEIHFISYCSKKTLEKTKNITQYDEHSYIIASPMTVHAKHLKYILENEYDLVYGNTHNCAFYSILDKLKGLPIIFDMHGGNIEEFLLLNQPNPSWWRSPIICEYFLKKFVNFVDLRFSDKIICVSRKMIEYLHEKNGIPFDRMEYVTNGVDLDFFRPLDIKMIQDIRVKLRVENKLVIGYIGGPQRWQGIENFIEAAQRINDKDLAFLITANKNNINQNNITFIPKIPRVQLPNYYSICDVLVLPRPSHPATEIAAPTKFAEYTAMGKPILTTNVGDAAEFVKKYNCGIVVRDNRIENLTQGILEFRNRSPNELRVMGEKARILAQNEFDWKKVGINLLKTVESI